MSNWLPSSQIGSLPAPTVIISFESTPKLISKVLTAFALLIDSSFPIPSSSIPSFAVVPTIRIGSPLILIFLEKASNSDLAFSSSTKVDSPGLKPPKSGVEINCPIELGGKIDVTVV